MKKQEELNEWMQNLPQSEKAKMMFQIKKSEVLNNEEIKKKVRLTDVNEDNIDLLIETFPDADYDRDEIKALAISNNKLIENNINIEPTYEVIEPKKKSIFKEILLSILYPFVAFIITSLVYVLIAWFLDNVIINMLNWFNSLNFWLKIFLLIIGISTALSLVFNLARILNAIICGLMNLLFPINTFTIIIGIMFSIINSTALLIQLWRIVPYWDLWFLAEFIIVASFIISMNSMLIPRKTNYDRYN
ncbi:hypothetical protein ACM55G_06950 [Flavobacterium sp. LB3P122]|uniref:hypothetical protein n=1 Tax=Flavobacterium algoriphilum TaxID=3398738 RepID=UPI003A835925